MADAEASDVLVAPVTIEYPFRRTTGPVLGAFFTGLRDGFVVGIRGADGRVLCPPQEYDPVTAEPLTEIVELGDAGEVVTAAWAPEPLATQPLERPFAWALIKLDGADTALLHAVDSGDAAPVAGTRVKARWKAAEDRDGSILDIECFELEGAS